MKLGEVIVIVVVLVCATVLTALGQFSEAIAGFYGLALGYLGKSVVSELPRGGPKEQWKPGP